MNNQPPDIARQQDPSTPRGRMPTWPGTSGLLLGWSTWLLTAWVWATWLSYGTVWLGDRAVSLAAAGRYMLAAALAGMFTAWPVLRLSQAVPAAADSGGARLTVLIWMLRDWMGLNLVLAAVVLALAAGTTWRLGQVLAVLALAGGWSLLVGLLIAWGAPLRGELRRILLTASCVALLFGGNFLPLRQMWMMAGPSPAWDAEVGLATLAPLWAVAVVAAVLSAAAMRIIGPWGRNNRCCGDL